MTRKLSPHVVARAKAIYKLWTEKEPDDSSLWEHEVEEQSVNWDELDVRCIGVGGDILYLSDKWEKPGVIERYHHPFDSGPRVYCAAEDAGGDEGESVSVAQLLGVQSLKHMVGLVPIAICSELVVQRPGERHLTWRFSQGAATLCSTLDKKGLVIISQDKGPIFVRGGRMRVTARGIVG